MKLTNTIKISLAGLKANKLRSALTILGIVIGITSIILVVAIGNGAQSLILGEIQSMGSRTLTIEPGAPATGFQEGMMSIFRVSLTEKDLEALQKKTTFLTCQKLFLWFILLIALTIKMNLILEPFWALRRGFLSSIILYRVREIFLLMMMSKRNQIFASSV